MAFQPLLKNSQQINIQSLSPLIHSTLTDKPITEKQFEEIIKSIHVFQNFEESSQKLIDFTSDGISYESLLIAIGIP